MILTQQRVSCSTPGSLPLLSQVEAPLQANLSPPLGTKSPTLGVGASMAKDVNVLENQAFVAALLRAGNSPRTERRKLSLPNENSEVLADAKTTDPHSPSDADEYETTHGGSRFVEYVAKRVGQGH